MTTDEFTAIVTEAKSLLPKCGPRIDRGADLVRKHLDNRALTMFKARIEGEVWHWTVKSPSGATYHVTQWADKTTACDCMDSQQGHICKHRWAVRMLRRLMN